MRQCRGCAQLEERDDSQASGLQHTVHVLQIDVALGLQQMREHAEGIGHVEGGIFSRKTEAGLAFVDIMGRRFGFGIVEQRLHDIGAEKTRQIDLARERAGNPSAAAAKIEDGHAVLGAGLNDDVAGDVANTLVVAADGQAHRLVERVSRNQARNEALIFGHGMILKSWLAPDAAAELSSDAGGSAVQLFWQNRLGNGANPHR